MNTLYNLLNYEINPSPLTLFQPIIVNMFAIQYYGQCKYINKYNVDVNLGAPDHVFSDDQPLPERFTSQSRNLELAKPVKVK